MSDEKAYWPSEAQAHDARLNRELYNLARGDLEQHRRMVASMTVQLQDAYADREKLQDRLRVADKQIAKMRVELNDVADGLVMDRRGKPAPKWATEISHKIKGRLYTALSFSASKGLD